MKTHAKYIRTYMLWVVSSCWVLFCLFSCMREHADCPSGLYLTFYPINPKHDLMELLEEVDIYLYDPEDTFIKEYHYKNTELRPTDYAALISDIPFGCYRAVVIINQGKYFDTFREESYSSLYTDLMRSPDDRPLPNLFTGETLFSYGLTDLDRPEIPVDVFKHANHIRVNLLISGNTLLEDNPEACIKGRNGSFHYKTYSAYSDELIIYPAEWYDSGENINYRFRITTLRMWIGGDIKLYVETSEKNIELDLPVELAKIKNSAGVYLYDTDEKLEYEDEYNFDIILDENMTIIGLSINGWHIVYGGTDV